MNEANDRWRESPLSCLMEILFDSDHRIAALARSASRIVWLGISVGGCCPQTKNK